MNDLQTEYTYNLFTIFIYITTGIKDVNIGKETKSTVIRTIIYSINGAQLDKTAKGINIIKEIYANGSVKTRKVMVK
ncbi:MAG: hypothetical protein K2G86_04775 [Prevotella sp.]|nr:hypothetical protein [Prevotella sp.]